MSRGYRSNEEPSPPHLVLASSSPQRVRLLAQIGVVPSAILSPDIDETVARGETPGTYAARMARDKARAVSQQRPGAFILGADTVIACGRRILPKATDERIARDCIDLLSGRRHQVCGAICLLSADGHERLRVARTRVAFARLSDQQKAAYIASGEWVGKAGGYAIQGLAAAHVKWINGSYTNVVGLPTHETYRLLHGVGML